MVINRRRKKFKVGTIYHCEIPTNPSFSLIKELLEMDVQLHEKRKCYEVIKRTKYYVFFKDLKNNCILKRKSYFFGDDYFLETCHIANKCKLFPIKANQIIKEAK
tara:strand:+ start:45 stop:359 length:315 start_codon:yes stop_codon:yes gene_type:complete